MSATSLASLVVSLEANIAKFSTDMRSAAAITQQSMSQIEEAATLAKRALGAVAGAMSVGAVMSWAKDVVASASALDDLADSTGSSVESLSRLANQAKISGVSFDTLQSIMLKLAAGMNGADEESSNVGRALAYLGVTAKDPADALQQVADKLIQYRDSTGKAALARDLFGKGGPAFLAMLKDLAQAHEVAATVTTQQAAEAEKLEQGLRRLSVESVTFKNILLSNVVPALNDAIERFRIARAAGLGFWDALNAGTVYDDRISAVIERLQGEQQRLLANQARAQKASDLGQGNPYALQKYAEDLKKVNTELQVYQQIQSRMLQNRVDFSKETEFGNLAKAIEDAAKQDVNYRGGADKTKASIADYAAEIQKLQDEMLKLSGPGGGYDHLLKANEQYQKDLHDGKVINVAQVQTMMQLAKALDEQAIAQARLKVEIEAAAKAQEAAIAAADKNTTAAEQALGDYADHNALLAREIELIGADDAARQRLAATIEYENAKKKLLLASDVEGLRILDEQYQARLKLIDQGAAKTAAVESAKQYAEEWARVIEDVSRGLGNFFTDLIENGTSSFKRLWDNFKHWALSALAEVAAKQVVVSLVGVASGAAAGSSAASTLGSLGGAGNLLSGLGAAFGLGEGASMGIGTALSNIGTILPTLMETGSISAAFAGMASSFAVIAPWAAIAAIAIPLVIKAFDKGPAMRTGDFASSTSASLGTGNPLFQGSSAFGSFGVVNDKWFSDSDMGSQFKAFLAGITSIDNAISSLVGKDMTGKISQALAAITTGFEAGVEHQTVTFGDIVGQRYVTVLNTIHEGLGELLKGFTGTGEEMAKFVVGLAQTQIGLEALNLKGLDIQALQGFQVAGESLPDTFARVSGAYTSFVNSFTTDAERLSSAQTLVTSTFAQLGMAVPSSVTAYRELVQSLDLSTDSGRAAFQALLNISGAFLTVQQAAAAAGTAVAEVGKTATELAAIERQRGNLQVQIMQLEGDTAGATALQRKLELDQMDESLRPLQQRIWALQDEQAAADAAAKAAQAAADAAQKAADAQQALIDAYTSALQDVTATVDPLTEALAANGSEWEKLAAQAARLDMLATYYDQTAAATQTLQQATQSYHQTLVQTLAGIEQLKGSLADLFGQTIRKYTMDGLDAEGQYKYLQDEVSRAMAELATAVDPARIQALAQLINSDQNQAYGLLSPDQKAAAREQFIAGAQAANDLVQQRLQSAEDAAIARNDKLVADLRAVLLEAGATETAAANTMLSAAQKLDGATINVQLNSPAPGAVGSY